jgi:8-oxo-dGTP pyrophosphatase MutT (NUDIX family)
MDSSSQSPSGGGVPHWEFVSAERVADCRVFRVDRGWFRHPARQITHDFFVLDSADWVNAVGLTRDREIILVNQYRFGTRECSWEIPGGLMDAGEDPIAAARRELLEETGFGGGEARMLGAVRPNPAVQNNWCHFVWLDGIELQSALAWDEHEEIECARLPVAEVLEWARTGRINHSLTLAALFLFEPHWRGAAG